MDNKFCTCLKSPGAVFLLNPDKTCCVCGLPFVMEWLRPDRGYSREAFDDPIVKSSVLHGLPDQQIVEALIKQKKQLMDRLMQLEMIAPMWFGAGNKILFDITKTGDFIVMATISENEIAIIKLVSEISSVSEDKITPSSNFIADLGCDSLDLVELVMEFEDVFDTEVPDEQAEQLQTVQDIFDYVEKHNLSVV